MTDHPDEDVDRGTEELADALDLDVTELVRLLGSRWSPVERPEDVRDAATSWWVGGEPATVMLGLDEPGQVTVGVPRGHWDGPGTLCYAVSEPETVSLQELDQLQDAVARAVSRRRRTFRYCSTCRGSTPPEHREGDTCHACLSRWFGVRF